MTTIHMSVAPERAEFASKLVLVELIRHHVGKEALQWHQVLALTSAPEMLVLKLLVTLLRSPDLTEFDGPTLREWYQKLTGTNGE